MDIGPFEAETFWTAFLQKLARHGLRGIALVVSDSHEGIKAVNRNGRLWKAAEASIDSAKAILFAAAAAMVLIRRITRAP